jgi:hypothetical protein
VAQYRAARSGHSESEKVGGSSKRADIVKNVQTLKWPAVSGTSRSSQPKDQPTEGPESSACDDAGSYRELMLSKRVPFARVASAYRASAHREHNCSFRVLIELSSHDESFGRKMSRSKRRPRGDTGESWDRCVGRTRSGKGYLRHLKIISVALKWLSGRVKWLRRRSRSYCPFRYRRSIDPEQSDFSPRAIAQDKDALRWRPTLRQLRRGCAFR